MPHQKTRNGQKRRVGVSCLLCAVMMMTCVFMWSTLTFTGRPSRVGRQAMVIRCAEKKAAKAAKDNHANQKNPNHPEYKGKNGKKKSKSKPTGAASTTSQKNSKSSVDNRANQKNRNNDQYQRDRGHAPIPPNQKQKVAEKGKRCQKQGAAFGQKNNRTPTGRLNTAAFHRFEEVLQQVVPGALLRKTGSQLKGTATEDSDWDYQIVTKEPMTRVQRDTILQSLEGSSAIKKVSCKKAFTVTPKSGKDIDFFPQKAEWHINVSVQKPGSVKLTKGARVAVKALKKKKNSFPHGHYLEQLIFQIQRDCGWTDHNDPWGEKRFQEAQRRLRSSNPV